MRRLIAKAAIALAWLSAASLALAQTDPATPEPAEPLPGDIAECASGRGGPVLADPARWRVIEARGLTRPEALGALLREGPRGPEGQRIIIAGGDFSGRDMRMLAPMLANACFVGTVLDGTLWEGASIPGLQLVGASLAEARAAGVRWPGLIAYGASFQAADFSGAELADLVFTSAYRGADFEGTRFRAARLVGARFVCGITIDNWCLGEPDLAGADLTRADIGDLGLWESAALADARIDATILAPRQLTSLERAALTGPVRLAAQFYGGGEGASLPQRAIAEITPEEARTLIALTRSVSPAEDQPSFACAAATTPTEKLICGQYAWGLRAADRELAVVWRALRSQGKGDLAEQRRWLRARASCTTEDCLAERYQRRLDQLYGLLGPGIALVPGQSRAFHSDALPLPEAARSGALYARIVPVLAAASYQQITLTGQKDGSIQAEGEAVGANAHMCSLGAVLRFDPATGWWSAASAAGGTRVPILRVSGRAIHLRYSGNAGDTPDAAADYISCGARAGFSSGVDLSPR